MKLSLLYLTFLLGICGCNNSDKKMVPESSESSIDYGDQGLNLIDGNNVIKLSINNVHIYSDTLNVNYVDSLHYYFFRVYSFKDSSWCDFIQEISMADSSYRKPTYKTLKKDIHVKLERKKYPTSKLTGNINVQLERHHTWTKDFKDTIIISGFLKSTLD